MMKKTFFILSLICLSILTGYAQERVELIIDDHEETNGFKNHGGFILDINQDFLRVPQWELPKFELMPQFKNPDFIEALNLNQTTMTFGKQDFNYSGTRYSTWNMHQPVDGPMNSATFRVNSRMNMTTFGDYDANGNKRRMPTANPWDKDSFRGGFELKSNNGKFGIRMEVEQRRGNPYGPNW